MEPNENREQNELSDFAFLLNRARSGDSDAASKLVENYRHYLLLIANQDLDSGLQAKLGPSDVVQQSIMNAQRNFEQFRGDNESELRAWLRKIVQNDLLKTRRDFRAGKRDANREINLDEHSVLRRNLAGEQMTPASEALKKERIDALDAAMRRLPPDYRQVIELRNLEQLGFNEIGKQMERSADAVRKLWARAIDHLQNVLKSDTPELMSGIYPPPKPDE
ncbi:MAG: sigma-70 family RNA polymerase sigma factor [Pirellulaceae bacterium]